MKRIVSVSPTWIEADSRLLKEANSFAENGFESVVVEGGMSDLSGSAVAFQLRSMGVSPPPSGTRLEWEAERRRSGRSPRARAARRGRPTSVPERVVFKPVRRAASLVGSTWGLFRRCFWVPFRMMPKADVYYLHAPYQYPAVAARSWLHRAPFVYDAHDFYGHIKAHAQFPSQASRVLDWVYRGFARACVRRAEVVVTVSPGIARLMEAEYGRPCRVVRNCHDARLDRDSGSDIRGSLGLPRDAFLVVSIGQDKPGAAIEQAVAALSLLPSNVHIAFLGRGYDARIGEIRPDSAAYGRVHAVPPVKPYEVVPFVRSADAALLLYYGLTDNYLHSLPNRFFQSIAAELPLLFPPLPEIRALAEAYGVGILVDPQKAESIASGIAQLHDDRGLYLRCKEHLKAASDALSWEKEERALMTAIADALGC